MEEKIDLIEKNFSKKELQKLILYLLEDLNDYEKLEIIISILQDTSYKIKKTNSMEDEENE